MRSRISLVVLALAAACNAKTSGPDVPSPAGGRLPTVSPDREPTPPSTPHDVLTAELLRTHTRALADDAMEGRGPGTEGGRRAVAYLVTAMKDLALEPAGDNDYKQRVHLRAVHTVPDGVSLRFEGSRGKARPVPFGQEFVGTSFRAAGLQSIDAPLVFAGYGVTAPEYGWDDYAQIDVTNKIVVVFVGDPPTEDGRFEGPAMTYYGRWTYKLERALEAGAAGCLIVHESEPASYGWNVVESSWGAERFRTIAPDGSLPPALAIEGWIHTGTAEALAVRAGSSLAKWHKHALRPGFRPIPLPDRLRGSFHTEERRVVDDNVIGRVAGGERADEAVFVVAHWDHLGVRPTTGEDEDAIFNGAVDNASGIATLLGVAAAVQSRARSGHPPRRSVVFLATTAEEHGLLGAEYYVEHPIVPLPSIVGLVNLDSMNVGGRTNTIEMVGAGRSTLEDVLADVAQEQHRTVVPDSRPESGGYFRSDHFSFAKRGVPALYFHAGKELESGGLAAGEAWAAAQAERYHTVNDEYDPSWSFEGTEQDAQAVLEVVLRVADAPSRPTWKPPHTTPNPD